MEPNDLQPFFSLIILVDNRFSFLLDETLMSITTQEYKNFELIVILDKALESKIPIIESYRDKIQRIYPAINPLQSFMMNKGIELSKGKYLHFIFPGEFFLSDQTLSDLERLILGSSSPHLIESGYVRRLILRNPVYHLEALTRKKLIKGEVPLSLRPFFFKREIFDIIGKFNRKYKSQGGFDLLCRIFESNKLTIVHINRIFSDSYVHKLTPKQVIMKLQEILLIIHKYYGFGRAFFWWIMQNHLEFLRWWLKTLKSAFWNAR